MEKHVSGARLLQTLTISHIALALFQFYAYSSLAQNK
jgi:hypothetical protein